MKYNPVFTVFLRDYYLDSSSKIILSYLLETEKEFYQYYEAIHDAILDGEYDENQYHPKFHSVTTKVAQRAFLKKLWDGRDARSGALLQDNDIDLHHYGVLYKSGGIVYFQHYDSRLVSLVPLSKYSHGTMNNFKEAKLYEARFRRVMEKLMRGEWATPDWWLRHPNGEKNLRAFEQNLIDLGYCKPSIFED